MLTGKTLMSYCGKLPELADWGQTGQAMNKKRTISDVLTDCKYNCTPLRQF